MKDLISKLKLLGSIVDRKFKHVNYGGCAVYASLVSKELQVRGFCVAAFTCGYDHHIRDITQARSNIKANVASKEIHMHVWEENGVSFHHVGTMILYRGNMYMHDIDLTVKVSPKSDKRVEFDHLPVANGFLTTEEVTYVASTGDGWNSTFDRKQIKGMKQTVESFFKLHFDDHV